MVWYVEVSEGIQDCVFLFFRTDWNVVVRTFLYSIFILTLCYVAFPVLVSSYSKSAFSILVNKMTVSMCVV